ncbi:MULTISPECIES: histidine phosphatase family protein [Moraxella]|uniref:Alpha-ribazole phosphatase n=1 Tax=Moraxella lacunata TaxID=477 RepID=A0A1B8PVH1_MORLA|nr:MULTISPECIES: histidine phosphatase family protein [Moraxella]MBE9589202.1 histidine phosphatase family protein [Moraxella sp. K1630]MBE9597455.1 histidine phosphatase family protein [Moraxella sp. K2450]MDH9219908.1 histidine phosphatase family protein [Moraxella lacunata]MDI4484008.1 histidine phosphatase family protein [Moraxella lacunata]MDI4508456.1 histidine phosphatase family protein [Moraxella lacunata]
MKKFYLIRHAQSESNAGHAIRPNHEIAITKLGQTQATDVADWLITHVPTPDKVFVSSYIRTHQTAQPYLDRTSMTPVQIDDLREFNYLDYEHIKDLTLPQIVKMADDYWVTNDKAHTDSPTTDNFVNLAERVKAVRDAFDVLPDGTYVVFTHGMWLGMLMWQLMLGYHGGECPRLFNMIKFREFELAVRPKNCEVYLMISDDGHNAISKVRARGDD